jgi:hypothetical protein
MDDREMALYIFRRLVYVLYLEIGALQPSTHPEIAGKAKLNTSFFQRDKARQAADLYRQIENEAAPAKILAPFEERTGLTLADIARAFGEGNWRNKYGGFNYGGPKWARIAEATLELRRLIENEDWEETAILLHKIKGLKNNQGYLIHQLEWTERRR